MLCKFICVNMNSFSLFIDILNYKKMENTVLQRIRRIIDYASISDRKFAEYIGIPQTTLSSLFQRGNEPNVTIIQSILGKFPNISMGWLLFGHGNMFITPRGEKLRHIRESLNLSSHEFAEKLGVKDEYYMRMESGEIPIGEIYKDRLITYFGITPDEIPYDKYADQIFLGDILSATEQIKVEESSEIQPSNIQSGAINTNYQGSFKDVHTSINSSDEINEISQLRKENILLRKEIEKLKNDLLNEKERLIKVMLKE